jgi:3-oxoacyl-[acyl-carrier protein] reductase/pteridine reductase
MTTLEMTTLEMTTPGMTANARPLSGKTMLVTGAAKRLGRAIALAAAANGADVAITYRQSEREARAVVEELARHGVEALAVGCDVADEQSVREMVKEVAKELGAIDVLVNNAATYETVEFEKITVAQWDAAFASNARGPFLVSRAALPYLKKRKGRIVNMGSLGGLRPWATHAHYCSSKAALHMLTRVMAKALAPEIAVNAVAPGMIDLGEKSAAAFMRKMAKQTPMRRNGSAADIAAAVMFFATAPKFITGQVLAIDGGLGL